jgi:hypothetical protein
VIRLTPEAADQLDQLIEQDEANGRLEASINLGLSSALRRRRWRTVRPSAPGIAMTAIDPWMPSLALSNGVKSIGRPDYLSHGPHDA